MFSEIKKQRNVSNFWGAAKVTYTHVAPYANLGTFLFSTVIFWYTTGWRWSWQYLGFNITYPGFMACLIIGGIIFAIIIYKYEMPSTFKFNFDQMYKHSTLLPADISEIKRILNKEDRRRKNAERILRRKSKRNRNMYSQQRNGIANQETQE